MTGAGAGTAGADDAVTAARLAAQGMGNPVTGSARIAGDDMAVVTQFLARSALLGLGQWAQRKQHGKYTE